MYEDPSSLIKQREIRFALLHPEPRQAHAAIDDLRLLQGVHETQPVADHVLHVRYDVTIITLNVIEDMLLELGYHLDNSLMVKLRRALYYYTEETQRENMGLEEVTSVSTQVFINRYQRLRHGCRDQRPEHWRRYS